MSAADEESLKTLTKRLGRLVLEAKSGRKDKQLKGLLVQLKTEVLRNEGAAKDFRESHGLHFLYNIIEHHPSVRETILAVTCSLLANLTTLDDATKRHVCVKKNVNYLVEILEQARSADVINCASRLFGNVVADLGLEEDSSLPSRVSEAIVRHLRSVVQANCRQSLLRSVRHLTLIPTCKSQLLRRHLVPQICQFLEAEHEEVTSATLRCLEALCITDHTEVVMQLARVSQFSLLVKGTTCSDPATAHTAVNILLACGRVPECRVNLGSSGAVQVFIRMLTGGERQEPEVRKKILKVLCLCCRDVVSRRKMKAHDGLSVLVKELRSSEYGVDDPIIKSILEGFMCYYFDDLSLRFMVQKLDLARVLGNRLQELVATMRAVESKGMQSHVTVRPSLIVEADRHSPDCVNFSSASSFQGSETSTSRSVSAQSSGGSSRSVTPVETSMAGGDAVVPVVAACHQAPTSPDWSLPTDVFESMLEDIAMSPPIPHTPRMGASCGSPEGFVSTPHNIIDHLLTAPSPYSSPAHLVASTQQPNTVTALPSGSSATDHPLLALVSRLSFLQDCLPSLAQEDLLIPLVDYLALASSSDSQCFATLTRIFKNHHCLSSCVTAVVLPHVWHLPARGHELLQCISSVATTPFGVGILANLLLRGTTKEKVAASLSIPFVCWDRKVLQKLMVAYSGFSVLSDIVLQQSDEAHPYLDTALKALFAIMQAGKLLPSSELGAPQVNVAREIVHVAESIHVEESKVLPFLTPAPLPPAYSPLPSAPAPLPPASSLLPSAPVPLPPASVSSCPHETPSGNDTPPHKKARIECETDPVGCSYHDACKTSPPDITFIVGNAHSSTSSVEHAHCSKTSAPVMFCAHRQVMGEASDFFASLLCGSFREASEDQVQLQDIEPTSFEILMHHIYGCWNGCKQMAPLLGGPGETATENSFILSSLLAAADRFMMPELLRDSEKALCHYVKTDTVLELFSLSMPYHAPMLQRRCVELVFSSAESSVTIGRKFIASGMMPDVLAVLRQATGLQ